MASHIATEEWQSFELRMRRRRAERMLVRAEAALDSSCFEEARAALDEARRLCPSLPSLDDVEAKITQAAARAERRPVGAGVRRALTAAASLAIIAAASTFGWRAVRNPSQLGIHPKSPVAAVEAAPSSTPPSQTPPNPSPAPSIRIQTEQVPPVIVSGESPDVAAPAPTLSAANAVAEPATLKTSDAAAPRDGDLRAVGTAGPAPPPPEAPSPTPADVGAIAALGTETTMAAPEPIPDRVVRAPAASITRDIEPASASLPVKGPDDTALVRSTLRKYAEAYTRLDADAAKAVWPSVNRAALSRAFNGLTEQRIAFDDCSVDVHSTQARAMCSGSTTWEPKIGGGSRTDVRKWAFDLEKSGDGWIIRDARVQNR